MSTFSKDPDAILDYRVDWTAWLAAIDADTISTSTWVVPAGITKDSDSNDTTSATAWLSGGTLGESYEVVNRIETAAGRTNDQTLTINIAEH